jgi:hypothetical protein
VIVEVSLLNFGGKCRLNKTTQSSDTSDTSFKQPAGYPYQAESPYLSSVPIADYDHSNQDEDDGPLCSSVSLPAVEGLHPIPCPNTESLSTAPISNVGLMFVTIPEGPLQSAPRPLAPRIYGTDPSG